MNDASISLIVVTCNRLGLLQQCIRNVVGRVSERTGQIIVWDNASTDGSSEFLGSLNDPRIQVVRHDSNIGVNAYAPAFALAKGDFFIELDDDVIDAPARWDEILLEAFRRVPKLGFLASSVLDDGKSTASQIFYHRDKHLYIPYEENGVNLLRGPVGGWCAITSRAVYEEVGGFGQHKDLNFWREDGEYVRAIERAGYRAALLADLKVLHASGPAYSKDSSVAAEKARFYSARDRKRRRKEQIKQILESIPPIRALNRRLHLYTFMPERLQTKDHDEHLKYWKGE